jgi:hypothetical protein
VTVQNALVLGFAFGLLVSPLLVLVVMATMRSVRDREDPWW